MNRRQLLSLLGISPALLAGTHADAAPAKHQSDSGNSGSESKFVALSPKATPPPVQRFPMAAPPKTLDGKTVYLVDTGFFGADIVLHDMADWFKQNMPSVKTVFRRKAGTYPEPDPKLWAEIKANANACIMAIGH